MVWQWPRKRRAGKELRTISVLERYAREDGEWIMTQIIKCDEKKIIEEVLSRPAPTQKALELFIEYALDHQTKTVREDASSYWFKHRVEELSKAIQELDPTYRYEYISNEDFICAAVRAGFKVKNTFRGDPYKMNPGPNYYFNIRKLKKDWLKEILGL